jgi:ribosomal protein S18 acetylase RimI-like enzyme
VPLPLSQRAEDTPQIVDLRTVAPAALEDLWRHEAQWWRTQLCWDIADGLAALRRVMARGGVAGKAMQVGTQIVGYGYAMRIGDLGMLSGPVFAPAWDRPDIGTGLLHALLDMLRQPGVRRIESPGIALASAWLVPAYEQVGFWTTWRTCLRLELAGAPQARQERTAATLVPWQGEQHAAVAAIMHAAYQTTVDAEINRLYRTPTGCHHILEALLSQGSCGPLVPDASALAYVDGQAVGFVVATASAPRQGHLAHVAVLPAYQGQGIGRQLVEGCRAQLQAQHFDTLSLIVSRANAAALALYEALGLRDILTFPVFVWEDSRTIY